MNNQNQTNLKKGISTPVGILIIVICLLLAGGILAWQYLKVQKEEIKPPEEKYIISPGESTTEKPVNWESLIPDIRLVLKQEFSDISAEGSHPIRISEKTDITGDGVSEVLVYLGVGGATTDFFTLLRIENDKPVVAYFKQKDGKISSLMFTAGAGGAGRYGSTVKMLADKNAIYSASYSAYGDKSDYCRAEVYQWNAQTKIFEFNTGLSNEIQQDFCRKTGPESEPPLSP